MPNAASVVLNRNFSKFSFSIGENASNFLINYFSTFAKMRFIVFKDRVSFCSNHSNGVSVKH
jgi:hypothetical protein